MPSDSKQSQSGYTPEALFLEKQCNTELSVRQTLVLVLSKLDQVLEKNQDLEHENRFLKAQLSAIRENQGRIDTKLEEMVDWKYQHVRRTLDLENRSADIDTRVADLSKYHEDLEERQAELEDRQAKTEEKCDNIELEITDHVHNALRDRLIGALETM
jgi:chromosome segregation ATPase